MENGVKKLSIGEKIGYGLGDAASNLFFQIFIIYLSYFYTDIFGIPAAALGTMMLVTRIWDAVNDPIMGMIADRTNSRWGKFRPWLLWCAVPFGVLGVLMFTTPNLGPTGKLIWAYVTYTAMTMIYTAINVPYSALMGVITPDSMDRTVVSSFRFALAFVGTFSVQLLLTRMVRFFGQGNETVGWQWAAVVFSCAAVILFLVTFTTTRERVQPPKGKNPILHDVKDLLTNIPWLLIGGATVFQLAFIVMRGSCIPYFFKYYIQDREISLFGMTKIIPHDDLSSYYLMAGTVFTLAGAVLSKWFSLRLGKPQAYLFFLILCGLSTAAVYFLDRDNLGLLLILQLIASFSVGPVSVLQWAIYTDTADYSEWKNGRRATALIMAASLFALKMGVAIGGALLAWILAAYGYNAENAEQTPTALTGIRMSMSLYPSVFAFLGAALMLFYPLSNQRMKQIESDLIARRKQYESQSIQ
ncbi:MAG TPA: MFS transporter [Anaerohalosphaeraceae bacterium]|nr:MFS transporter [Anaerohalosphaeraceae bacterium]HOL89039.1 MFS transporter [Anaerohalosphaeraceae bacterium]HPP56927.1 MFS transporter [Anaerohalosphaeraceae bacterium]